MAYSWEPRSVKSIPYKFAILNSKIFPWRWVARSSPGAGHAAAPLFPFGPERGESQWLGVVKAACERAAQARLRTRTDAQQSRKEREKADFPVRLTR